MGCCVDLGMSRYLLLLLLIGLVWGQNYNPETGEVIQPRYDPQTGRIINDIINIDGKEFFGEYIKQENQFIYFHLIGELRESKIERTKKIKYIRLSDGTVVDLPPETDVGFQNNNNHVNELKTSKRSLADYGLLGTLKRLLFIRKH